MSNTPATRNPEPSPSDSFPTGLPVEWTLPWLRNDAHSLDLVQEVLYSLSRPKERPLQTPVIRDQLHRALASVGIARDLHRMQLEKVEAVIRELGQKEVG